MLHHLKNKHILIIDLNPSENVGNHGGRSEKG